MAEFIEFIPTCISMFISTLSKLNIIDGVSLTDVLVGLLLMNIFISFFVFSIKTESRAGSRRTGGNRPQSNLGKTP